MMFINQLTKAPCTGWLFFQTKTICTTSYQIAIKSWGGGMCFRLLLLDYINFCITKTVTIIQINFPFMFLIFPRELSFSLDLFFNIRRETSSLIDSSSSFLILFKQFVISNRKISSLEPSTICKM